MDGPFTPSSAPGLPAWWRCTAPAICLKHNGGLPSPSGSAEQCEELMQLSAQTFGSPELMAQLGQLDANLQEVSA